MKLVILDLDQTLVDFIAIHDETALELFRHFFGVDAKFTDVDYVGRSFADNFAEMARRALTIAVATGFHTAGELAACQPDYLFKSLRDYRKVIKTIGGNGNK
jgi:phosphoglycolate phosphatase-like HAD superfamily hydrolase